MNILAGKSAYVPEILSQDTAITARIWDDESQLSFEIEEKRAAKVAHEPYYIGSTFLVHDFLYFTITGVYDRGTLQTLGKHIF